MSSSVVPQPPSEFQLAMDPNPDPSPEDLKRRQATIKAWKAYHGEYQTPFKIEPGQPDVNVKPNRLRQIVDKNVAWLAGQQTGRTKKSPRRNMIMEWTRLGIWSPTEI
jgi:hypothetical protein